MPHDFSDFLKTLPHQSGVYRMYDHTGKVLYVGKASDLKKRVSSYFQKQVSVKTQKLLEHVVSIDISVTRSEKEALLLESTLIKTLKPKYNILMRDDKTYPYVVLSLDHPFPRMTVLRCKTKPQSKGYFGPYPDARAVRQTVSLIQKMFKIRDCSDAVYRLRTRPCLQYQLGRCSAPCTNLISTEAYQQSIDAAVLFLKGKSNTLMTLLTDKMNHAVQALAFEEAAVLRDQLQEIRVTQEQQGVIARTGCVDVIVVVSDHTEWVQSVCVQWVSVRQGQIEATQSYFPKMPHDSVWDDEAWQAIFEMFLMYFYQAMPQRLPEVILTNHPVEGQAMLEALLTEWRGKRCRIQSTARGARSRWIDFAIHNATSRLALKQLSMRQLEGRYEALRDFLGLKETIKHLVCFDISHTQGQHTVASCVVFDDKGPLRREYRRFNIHDIVPGDDYAAIEQAVFRYFSKASFLPQVVLIDGGQGQVARAKLALEALGLETLPLVGIAKGPARKVGQERLIISSKMHMTSLPATDKALHLLQYIRDEAHRFAISTHRKQRARESLDSSLMRIHGLGPKRRHALLQRFGGLQALAKASVEEISKVPGISASLAQEIYQHFHP